jgi:hypothetical protein
VSEVASFMDNPVDLTEIVTKLVSVEEIFVTVIVKIDYVRGWKKRTVKKS